MDDYPGAEAPTREREEQIGALGALIILGMGGMFLLSVLYPLLEGFAALSR